VDDHDIEATVDKQAAMMPAVITEVKATVDVASLFQDADGDTLTYTSAAAAPLTDGNYMRFDPDTGKLLYVTDNQQGHDGSDTDGAGNVVAITITATDPDDATATSNINIRLNTPPTAITGNNTGTIEETDDSAVLDFTAIELNVQDNNLPTHEFGQYTWVVSDDRFKITADTADSSQATLSVLKGKEFPAAGATNPTVPVKVTATEKASGEKVEFTVTVTINNNADNDPPTPVKPDPVPGLKDDDSDGTDDEADGDDSDQDGGLPLPPPPAMMFEDDLLDEFVLAIDDMDIA
jgi:hypothetical protein